MTYSRKGASAWRRRWRRFPPQERLVAATSLGDVFTRGRSGSLLPVMLAASVVLHAASVPLLPTSGTQDHEQLARTEDSYLRKVIQKDRAKHVAVDVSRKVTTAPPPPDPEQFVSETLAAELTEDLSQVTSGLLDVQLEKSLTEHVQASLEDELKQASKQIATGRLSKQEIKDLHRSFRQKAMDAARDWREEHREEYQVEIAAKTVTQWYEERVASQIRMAVQDSLFTGRARLWDQCFGNRQHAPGFIAGDRTQGFVTAHQWLSYLSRGRFRQWHFARREDRPAGLSECKDDGGGWMRIPGWPDKLTAPQAEVFAWLLRDYGKGRERAYDEYVRDYYPHRERQSAETKKQLAVLWNRLLAWSEQFRDKAKRGAPVGDLKEQVAGCLRDMKELLAVWGKVFVGAGKQSVFGTINRAMRSRVLRGPFRDEAYRKTIDLLVEKLRPPVEQLAEGQFREGMVLSEKGVHEAMKEFRVKAVALLKRDMEQTLTRPFFYRKLFYSHFNPYRDKITGESGPPSAEQIEADEVALQKATGKLESDKGYVQARTEKITEEVSEAIAYAIDEMLGRILTAEGRLERRYYAQAETVDYADPFKQKLEARDMAWKGRKQDMADLTEEGLPDSSSPLVALASGAGSGRIGLSPVVATMHPGFFARGPDAAEALRGSLPTSPPAPAAWGLVTQADVPPPFPTSNFAAIPFLRNFPNVDGNLLDWGRIRPLVLRQDNIRDPALKTESTLLYAAWNYQGFFFGYHVDLPSMKFSLPSQYRMGEDGVTLYKDPRISAYNKFVERGDFLAVMFDTLDARLPFRGDPHAQEFYILPRGSATDPDLPGAERVFASRRYGKWDGNFGWSRRISQGELFPSQPRSGPDGSGPHRVTRMTPGGYTVEVFLPRTVFKVPVFAPGWYVGFDAYVGKGKQPTGSGARYQGKGWANRTSWPSSVGNNPSRWGDLLLLGTDASVTLRDACQGWPRTTAIVPGHSYLMTVVDPDRNVHLAGIDTVLVSAEVFGASASAQTKASSSDVELCLLKETGKNTSIFQGYIDTQPGFGAEVHGALEVLPGSEVRLGYVDIADSRGRRNVIYEQKLPVISAALVLSRAGR